MSKVLYIAAILVFLGSCIAPDHAEVAAMCGIVVSSLFLVCYTGVLLFSWFANWLFDSW